LVTKCYAKNRQPRSWQDKNKSENNGDIGSISHPWIITHPSHHLGKYTIKVVGISFEGVYDPWGDINDVTYLLTDYIINPGVGGDPEPAKSILGDQNNISNLASGKVKHIKNNKESNISFLDYDNDDIITVGDEFIIDADIIPANALQGIDLYLIYEGEYHKGTYFFEVMERNNIGKFQEQVQLSLNNEDGLYNISVINTNESYFQGSSISQYSIQIYDITLESSKVWYPINDLIPNGSKEIAYFDRDNNGIISNQDYFIITETISHDFKFQIYYESSGLKVGSIDNN